MYRAPTKEQLLALSDDEKLARFDRLVEKTFSHVDGRDLLFQLHPRHQENRSWYDEVCSCKTTL